MALPAPDPLEPSMSFDHARMKVSWAKHNLGKLNALANSFIENKRNASPVHLDSDRETFQVSNGAMPAEIPLLAGDILFSLRSSLDCCWMGLQRSVDSTAEKVTLPRGDSRDAVIHKLGKVAIKDHFPNIKSIIVDKIAPYKGGNEILWFIAQVDNWNKHNMLALAMQVSTINDGEFVLTRNGGLQTTVNIVGLQLEGGLPVNLIRFGGDKIEIETKKQPNVAVEIILESRKPVDKRPLMPFLQAAVKETDKAVELFISAFGANP